MKSQLHQSALSTASVNKAQTMELKNVQSASDIYAESVVFITGKCTWIIETFR